MAVTKRPLLQKSLRHLALLPFLLFAIFPFYHMTLTSLKQDKELYDRYAVPLIIRQAPTLEHYTKLLFLPLAQVVNWLGLGDSKWALVLTYPTFLVPFCTWLLMGYFRTVPKEVEECAMVDGATRIQALWRIVLPIAVPGLVCAVLFAFTLSWNEFIYALTFTSSSEQITASVGVTSELIRGDIYFWGELMAGAILGSVPIVILYVFFLDYYVSGLTAGAIK